MDIFAIGETKLDLSFPESQFSLPGMRKSFRLDVISRKGGLLVFVNNNIPSEYLQSFHLPEYTQAVTFEISLKQCKLLVISVYQLPDQNLDCFLSSLTGLLYHYLKSYKDFVIMGDFNANESNPSIENFLNQHKCINIVKNKIYYKSQEGCCIDLIITSTHILDQFSHVFETGISGHRHMVYTMLKSTYAKFELKRDFKKSFL